MRWLLNNFTTWELALMLVGGAAVITVIGLALTRRWLPKLQHKESNDITGVMLGVLAVVYGIVLAFVTVALYEEYRSSVSHVREEATKLAEVYRDSKAFAPPEALRVKTAVGDYIYAVVAKEWRAQENGEESQQAWDALEGIYRAIQVYRPATEQEKTFYAESAAQVDALNSARRERLNDSEEALPTAFVVLLVVGALLLLFATFMFGTPNARLHMVLSLLVAVLIGLTLLTALVLDYPFSGEVSVSNRSFTQGSLSEFSYRVAGLPRS